METFRVTLPTVIGLDRAIVIGAGVTATGFIIRPGTRRKRPGAPLIRD